MKSSVLADWRVGEGKGGYLDAVDEVVEIDTLEKLMSLRCNFHTSHAVFRNNRKLNSEFLSADFLVFDFENALATPESIGEIFKDYNHGINASSNHMKYKDKTGILPRFHVVLPLVVPVTSPDDYSDIIKLLASKIKIDTLYDQSCTLASRYWKKQREILNIVDDKKTFNPTIALEIVHIQQKSNTTVSNKEQEEALRKYKASGEDIERFLIGNKFYQDSLRELNIDSMRHNAVCKLVWILKKYSIDKFTTVNIIRDKYHGAKWEHHEKTINNLYDRSN